MGPRYLIASIVAIWLAVLLAAVSEARLVEAQAAMSMKAKEAHQVPTSQKKKKKGLEEKAREQTEPKAAERDARLPWALMVMPPPSSVYAAVFVERSGHVWWRSWPLLGLPRLPPPVAPAGGMPACCCVPYIGPRYSLAFIVVI